MRPSDHDLDISLSAYSRVRFERLTKLSREAMSRISIPGSAASYGFLNLLRLYADLLAQALVEKKYSPLAEQRLLGHLSAWAEKNQQPFPRIRWTSDHLETDLSGASRKIYQRLLDKKGAISMNDIGFEDWKRWLMSSPLGSVDSIIAVLSRGLMDAAVISRLYGIPVRYVCYSRKRLRNDSVYTLDSDWIRSQCLGRTALVDSHTLTGETIRQCWQELAASGIGLAGALITDHEATVNPSNSVGLCLQQTTGCSAAIINLDAISAATESERGPLIVLCGYPGSGKTLVRKAVAQRTGWPSYSWARVVRRFLKEEFGDLSIETVRRLTEEEERDPEIVSREFLFRTNCLIQLWQTPLLVDGIKSLAALDCLKRHLGRTAIVVHIKRKESARIAALTSRNAFDDHVDQERNSLLETIGLSDLIGTAEFCVDTSESDVERSSGTLHLSASTHNSIETLLARIKGKMFRPLVTRRITATFVLLSPDLLEILLLKSAMSNKWGLPGGYVEPGEGALEAAKRELREETGLEDLQPVTECAPFLIRRSVMRGNLVIGEKVTAVFVARAMSRTVVLSKEHVSSRWLTATDAAEMLSFPMSLIPLQVFALLGR